MNQMRVLVIDDDVCIHDLAALALGSRGWEVLSAISGEEGIRAALANRPDVILLDVYMPAMDGPAVLKQLRSHSEGRNVPVIFLTAGSENANGEVMGAISKPFDPKRLAQQIEDMLKR